MAEAIPVTNGLPMTRSCPFDPPEELTSLRAEAPISRLIFPDGHKGWLVTNHRLARAVLADQRFSNQNQFRRWPIPGPRVKTRHVPTLPGMFSRLDPPEYMKYRKLLAGQLSVRRMTLFEPRLTEVADACIDQMISAGPPADLLRSYAMPIPSNAICELLGVPADDKEGFLGKSSVLVDMNSSGEDSGRAWAYLHDYMYRLVPQKRAHPGDDLLSNLTRSDLTDEELTGVGVTLLIAGLESTVNMIALGVYTLLNHLDQLAVLLNDASILENAIEELVRHQTIIHIGPFRGALEDVELGGQLVKRGEVVLVSLPVANRDPEQFDDPDTLELTRHTAGHVGFGHGVHQCTGQQLARAELRVSYSTLFRRLPSLRLAADPAEISMRSDKGVYGVKSLPVTWEH